MGMVGQTFLSVVNSPPWPSLHVKKLLAGTCQPHGLSASGGLIQLFSPRPERAAMLNHVPGLIRYRFSSRVFAFAFS